MKRVLQSIAVSLIVCFGTSFSCGQNGPTQPNVVLTWTQSTSPGISTNHVYRCTGANCTPAPPAIYGSTAPITTWTDTSVSSSTTYIYAVTASAGAEESPYSNTEAAAVPARLNSPVLGTPVETKLEKPGPKVSDLEANVIWKEALPTH